MMERHMKVLRVGGEEITSIDAELADFLCWQDGYHAGLDRDDRSSRSIMGVGGVRRARELLGRATWDDAPRPSSQAAPTGYVLTPVDRLAQEIHDALKTPLGRRAVAGVTLGEDAADRLAEAVEEMRWSRGDRVETPAAAVPEFRAGHGFALTPGNFEVGKRQAPGWAEGADKMLRRMVTESAAAKEAVREMFAESTAAFIAEHDPIGWASNVDGPAWVLFRTQKEVWDAIEGKEGWATPYPVYAQPRGPVMPAEGIVGWMIEDLSAGSTGPHYVFFCLYENAREWQASTPGYSKPVPVYAQPQPALEPDWPREITESMAESYGKTVRIGLSQGASDSDIAYAVLTEFAESHRPGPLSDPERARLRELEEKLDALTVTDRAATAWRSWTPGEQGTRLWANEEAARTAAGPDGRVTPLYDAPPREAMPADFGEVPTAFMVDCGSDPLRFRFWSGSRCEDAQGCADQFGVKVVPLYRSPEPAHIPEPSAWLVRSVKDSGAVLRDERDARDYAESKGFDVYPLYRLA